MSKYNNMRGISFSELREDEIEQAIREWSQGNIHMEKLLWACREHGVETMGCHPLGMPYLELAVNNSHDKIRRMLNAAQSVPYSSVLVMPDGGNPTSGEKTWYRPNLTITFDTTSRRKVNKSLDKLYEAIVLEEEQEGTENGIFMHMLDFHDFFAERESGLNLYMLNNKSGIYQFSIISRGNGTDSTYFADLFRRAGMRLDRELRGTGWSVTDIDEKRFGERVKKAKTTITEEYSLGIPKEIKPNMDLTIVARIMRRQFGDTLEGRERFSQWLQDLGKRMRLWIMKKITYEECFPWEVEANKTPVKAIEEDER